MMAMAAGGAMHGRVHPTLPCLLVQVNANASARASGIGCLDAMQAGIGACWSLRLRQEIEP
jgi:hypothetical protein